MTIGDQEDRLITFVLAQLVEKPTRFVPAEEFDCVGRRQGECRRVLAVMFGDVRLNGSDQRIVLLTVCYSP